MTSIQSLKPNVGDDYIENHIKDKKKQLKDQRNKALKKYAQQSVKDAEDKIEKINNAYYAKEAAKYARQQQRKSVIDNIPKRCTYPNCKEGGTRRTNRRHKKSKKAKSQKRSIKRRMNK